MPFPLLAKSPVASAIGVPGFVGSRTHGARPGATGPGPKARGVGGKYGLLPAADLFGTSGDSGAVPVNASRKQRCADDDGESDRDADQHCPHCFTLCEAEARQNPASIAGEGAKLNGVPGCVPLVAGQSIPFGAARWQALGGVGEASCLDTGARGLLQCHLSFIEE